MRNTIGANLFLYEFTATGTGICWKHYYYCGFTIIINVKVIVLFTIFSLNILKTELWACGRDLGTASSDI